ncbi:histidine phosphatase family protein [Aliiglaciecola sp.]|nr:histidine phosphatase family protein [Aliiglaciecola sp.]
MWIYLVRHGETMGNRQRIVQVPETPLSLIGEQQAQYLANAYKNAPISMILCSDYKRTQHTAKALHKKTGSKLILTECLRERNFGDLRGRSYDDIDVDFFAKDYHPPGGESHPQFSSRIKKAWKLVEELANQQTGDLFVMTHGLVVRCILSDILSLPADVLASIDVSNTCVTKINILDKSLIPLLCDSSHLPSEVSVNGGAV